MDWNLIGGAYQAANSMQDDQVLVNWYVEIDENEEAKSPKALLGCPGLQEAVTSTYTGEVRGGHVMPDGANAYLVVGTAVVKMTVASFATVTTPATFTLSTVGYLATSTGAVCMRDNGVAGLCVIVDGVSMYIVNTKTGTFSQSNDPNVIAPDRLASIDGWLIFNTRGTQKFNTTPNYWNGTDALDGTFFALKDDAPDNLVTLIEDKRVLWLIGEKTTEPWTPAPNTNFPYSRLEGAMLQVGCAAKHSVARTGHGLIWLGYSERGGNSVILTQGFDYTTISTPALSYALTQYNVLDDAIGWTYSEEGHEFYQLTFPSQDVTWCYDLTTKQWHQRQSLDSNGFTHRARANCLINFAGQRIVGDYQNGQIWTQSRQFYSDGTNPLIATRRSPYVWDKANRDRLMHGRLQLEFTPGVGLPNGQGQFPQVMLRWRDEKGWSNTRITTIGQSGDMANRAMFRRLGGARYRVYEFSVSDPVKRDLVGASLRVGGSEA